MVEAEPRRARRSADDVYHFWFPDTLDGMDHDGLVAMASWWMQGGATAALPPFRPIVEMAEAGGLRDWCATPRGRLSLIVVLDQFTRGLFAGTPRAYASDPAALELAQEGIRSGAYQALTSPWEQSFAELPLVHAEGPGHLERLDFVIAAAKARAAAAPSKWKRILAFAVGQPEGHRAVIARFGRFPHRNAALGRVSTPEEEAYWPPANACTSGLCRDDRRFWPRHRP